MEFWEPFFHIAWHFGLLLCAQTNIGFFSETWSACHFEELEN
jgi:hypothetical protein